MRVPDARRALGGAAPRARASSPASRSAAGIPELADALLVCVTEMHDDAADRRLVVARRWRARPRARRERREPMLLDEPLIFERGSRRPRRLAGVAGDATVRRAARASCAREDDLAGLPEVSELEVLRHFVRLSQWNYSAATTLYPLGSCTMKYNPMVNEEWRALPGFARLHPLVPDALAQGALELAVAARARRCARSAGSTPSRCSRPPARRASSPA